MHAEDEREDVSLQYDNSIEGDYPELLSYCCGEPYRGVQGLRKEMRLRGQVVL